MIYLALIGLTLIVSRGTIFLPIQKRWPAFKCAQCTGMWTGAAAGVSGIVTTGHGRILDAVIVGCATSFMSLAANAVLIRLLDD